MALPWLIGAALVGVVGAIAKAVSDDTSDSSSSRDSSSDTSEEEARRHRAAAQERERRMHAEKIANARSVFQDKGDNYGVQLLASVQGWLVSNPTKGNAFSAKISQSGYVLNSGIYGAEAVLDLLAQHYPQSNDRIAQLMNNLDFYGRVYDVELEAGQKMLSHFTEIEAITQELAELGSLKRRIGRFQSTQAAG